MIRIGRLPTFVIVIKNAAIGRGGMGEVWKARDTEYVPGETLAERIGRDGAIPLDEALAITMQICEALEHAHDKNIQRKHDLERRPKPP